MKLNNSAFSSSAWVQVMPWGPPFTRSQAQDTHVLARNVEAGKRVDQGVHDRIGLTRKNNRIARERSGRCAKGKKMVGSSDLG